MPSQAKTLTVSYTGPTAASGGDFVLIEQDKWDPNVNYLTKLGVVGYLNSLLYGGPSTPENCSNDSSYYVYCYPSRPGLNYLLGTSHGVLSKERVETLVYSEILNCDLKTELTPHYPVLEIVGKPSWIGDQLDSEGGAITLPDPVITNAKTVTIGDVPVYGSVLLTYKVCRHTSTLTAIPLPDAVENALQCWIYALFNGGKNTYEYRFPDGADTGTCQSKRTIYNITMNPPPDISCVSPEDEYHYVDFCDQKI